MLVTRAGRLRLVRNGKFDLKPISGGAPAWTDGNGGLMDVVLHPRFTENRLVYPTYNKPVENQRRTVIRARAARGQRLVDVRDLLVPDADDGNGGLNARLVFGRDGMIFCRPGAISGRSRRILQVCAARFCAFATTERSRPTIHSPGRPGYRPEMYTSDTAKPSALSSTRRAGPCGTTRTAPTAARGQHHPAGPQLRMADRELRADYPGTRISEHPTREGSSRRSSPFFLRSRLPAWPSIQAIVSRHGKAMSSSAVCKRGASLARAIWSDRLQCKRARSCVANRCSTNSGIVSGRFVRGRSILGRRRANSAPPMFMATHENPGRSRDRLPSSDPLLWQSYRPSHEDRPGDRSAHRLLLTRSQRQLVRDLSRHPHRHHPRRRG